MLERITKNKKWILIFVVHLIFIISYTLIKDLFIEDNSINNAEKDFKNNPIFNLILIVIVSPIIEEIIFRYPLRFNYLNILIIPIILLIVFLNESILIKFSFIIFFIILSIQRIFKKNTYTINLISVICFTLLHIGNYENINPNFAIVFSMIFPQLILGIILSYVRHFKNFKTCIMYHAVYNFIIILIYLTVE